MLITIRPARPTSMRSASRSSSRAHLLQADAPPTCHVASWGAIRRKTSGTTCYWWVVCPNFAEITARFRTRTSICSAVPRTKLLLCCRVRLRQSTVLHGSQDHVRLGPNHRHIPRFEAHPLCIGPQIYRTQCLLLSKTRGASFMRSVAPGLSPGPECGLPQTV